MGQPIVISMSDILLLAGAILLLFRQTVCLAAQVAPVTEPVLEEPTI